MAGDLADRKPSAAGKRRVRIDPEPSTADRLKGLVLIATPREAVRKSERESLAEIVRSSGRRPHVKTAEPGAGKRTRCVGTARFIRSPAAPADFEVGVIPAKAALCDQHSDVRGSCGEPPIASSKKHVGQSRFERKPRNIPAVVCEPPVFERAKAFKAQACLFERSGARWIDEGEAAGIGLAPNEACQEQA